MYRITTSTAVIQFFPGENGAHYQPLQNVQGISPNMMPGNYYSNPEYFGYPLQPSPWGFTEERRSSLALYDYRRVDSGTDDG